MPLMKQDRQLAPRNCTVAILSDLHGNADAFAAAIDQLQNLEHCQTLVILGDLFTYGCQPRQIVDLLFDVAEGYETWLVVGNHDEFYFDCFGYAESATEGRPDWIVEMIEWTRDQLADSGFERLNDQKLWHRDLCSGPLFLSHANPFEGRDWTYLNSDETRRRGAEAVATRGCRIGVFGHTHRRFACCSTDTSEFLSLDDGQLLGNETDLSRGCWVVNPGSVGQPREQHPTSSFLLLRNDDTRWVANHRRVDYTPGDHVEAIRNTELSASTRRKLISYLVDSNES